MTPTQHLQNIIDKATRDICAVSVAPAAKSKVREIVANALKEAYLIAVEEQLNRIENQILSGADPKIIIQLERASANRLREVGNNKTL